jgi:hypothetical protein
MNLADAYYEFSLLVNKNSERKDIQIDKLNYIVLYNRESPRWLSEFLERNSNTDSIYTLQEFLIDDFKLIKKQTTDNKVDYKLPEDFFSILVGSSYSKVKTKTCGESIIYNWFKKPSDRNIHLEDKSTQPSLAWERGIGELYKDKISIFKTNFDILETYITYYKTPTQIDINNPDMNLELASSYVVGQINDRIASEIYREFESNAYQLAKTREAITI